MSRSSPPGLCPLSEQGSGCGPHLGSSGPGRAVRSPPVPALTARPRGSSPPAATAPRPGVPEPDRAAPPQQEQPRPGGGGGRGGSGAPAEAGPGGGAAARPPEEARRGCGGPGRQERLGASPGGSGLWLSSRLPGAPGARPCPEP